MGQDSSGKWQGKQDAEKIYYRRFSGGISVQKDADGKDSPPPGSAGFIWKMETQAGFHKNILRRFSREIPARKIGRMEIIAFFLAARVSSEK